MSLFDPESRHRYDASRSARNLVLQARNLADDRDLGISPVTRLGIAADAIADARDEMGENEAGVHLRLADAAHQLDVADEVVREQDVRSKIRNAHQLVVGLQEVDR